MTQKYYIKCLGCGTIFQDNGKIIHCENINHTGNSKVAPGLLKTFYLKKKLEVKSDDYGFYKFIDWLPVNRMLSGSAPPVTYKSEKFAKELGLSELYITFNGYWPEKKADMKAVTFKQCDAYSVCARIPKGYPCTLVVASAGNTARAFGRVCSDNNIPAVIIVPETNLENLWFEEKLNSCVKLVASGKETDYSDATRLGEILCQIENFFTAGGPYNVARRDGMGTPVLSAVTTIGKIPDYYFQAIGSGTGGIAAWEANLRLIEDGAYGKNKMKLMLSQNAPFLLIHDSWEKRSAEIIYYDEEILKEQIKETNAKMLSNRRPPYSIKGGVYDALCDSDGDVIPVTNDEAFAAKVIFEETEGIDIGPESCVAVASLKKAVLNGEVRKNGIIMLNITNGGFERFKKDHTIFNLKPDAVIEKENFNIEAVKDIIKTFKWS